MHNAFGDKYGSIVVSIYKTDMNDSPFFHITSYNDIHISNIMDIIEDTLKKY